MVPDRAVCSQAMATSRSGPSALAAGSCLTFAPTWPNARLIPFAVVDRIVLTRPRQVSELAIFEQTADPASPAAATYLGDMSATQVQAALGPRLGDRLEIQVPATDG